MMRFGSFALLLALAPLARANPTQDLLRRVPPESSLCLVAQDWKGHAERLAGSPFAAKLKASDLGKSLLNADAVEKLVALEKVLTDSLHLTAEQLRDDILGDAVVYAFQPGAPDKPDDDAGVLLVKARNPKTLAKLIDDLNDAQKQAGELKALTERKFGELAYFRREKSDGVAEYYFVREGVFAFSRDERLVKRVLALDAAPPKHAPLVEAYDRLGLTKAALAFLFNPRPLDADFQARIAAAPDAPAKAFLKRFAVIWKATDSVALAVELGAEVELALHASFDPKIVPAELKPFLGTPKASALWAYIPSDALFALAGRLDLPQALALGKSFLSEPALKGLQDLLDKQIAPAVGREALPDLLQGVGPDWGVWLTAPGQADKGAIPDLTVALRVRAPESGDNALGDAVKLGLNFAFQVFRVEYNKAHDDQFALRESKDDAGPIQHLENPKLLPAGVRPAFAQRGDFFLLASSPEAIRRFDIRKDAPKEGDGPFLRIGGAALERYLRTHGEYLAKALAARTGKTAADVLQEFRELQQIVELLDSLEVRQTGTVGSTKWSVKLKLAAPLAK